MHQASSFLAFDIETIPDVAGIRLLYELPETLSDDDVVAFMQNERRAKTGSDFMPPHLQKVVAISCVLRYEAQRIHVGSMGKVDDEEETLLTKFFDLIDQKTPQLISWNGGGFDLPVLHYRGLMAGITAQRYWSWGEHENDKAFKWNNYTNRYHTRHCDLMDVLAMFNARNYVPLDDMAKLCGFPGKMGMDGSKVWDAYRQGRIQEIRDYCETDALNTYLTYLRFCLMRGDIDADQYHQEIAIARQFVEKHQEHTHWQEFLRAWRT